MHVYVKLGKCCFFFSDKILEDIIKEAMKTRPGVIDASLVRKFGVRHPSLRIFVVP